MSDIFCHEVGEGPAVEMVLESPLGRDMADHHDAALVKGDSNVSEEPTDTADGLRPALTAWIGVIEVSDAILMEFGGGHAVAGSVVAFTEPPVLQDGDIGIGEGDLGCLDSSSKVGGEDRCDAVVSSAVAQFGCEDSAFG